MKNPSSIESHQGKYLPNVWAQYSPEELVFWVSNFSKRAEHRRPHDIAKVAKDLYDAGNYLAMLEAMLSETLDISGVEADSDGRDAFLIADTLRGYIDIERDGDEIFVTIEIDGEDAVLNAYARLKALYEERLASTSDAARAEVERLRAQ